MYLCSTATEVALDGRDCPKSLLVARLPHRARTDEGFGTGVVPTALPGTDPPDLSQLKYCRPAETAKEPDYDALFPAGNNRRISSLRPLSLSVISFPARASNSSAVI